MQQVEQADRQGLRRPGKPAAGLGAQRFGDVDAGHDGYDSEPRSEHRHAAGRDPPDRRRALRLRRLPPLHPAVRQGRAGCAGRGVRRRVRRGQAGRACHRGCRSVGRQPARRSASAFSSVFEEHTGRPFPEDPYEQLEIAIKAVFGSWMGKRAVDYRREFKITPEMANGTAVNICTMVFGNRGDDSATGVAFTRNPGTGENKLYGEYLVNAQGEDVVAGIRTPKPIDQLARRDAGDGAPAGRTARQPRERTTRRSRISSSRSSAACCIACRRATAR